ncbi:MAG: helix-turn-helix transcriptional regulator [Clostridiales bacterium]|nr:helix-turn-helix transcriptional regulator [Clostridiales bacterium]
MNTTVGCKLCDKIIQLRKEKGLSQEQLADYLEVSRQAVSKWESDQSIPSLDKIIQLADLFGVSIDYLVRDNATAEEHNKTVVTTQDDTLVMEQLNTIKKLVEKRKPGCYEYKSKKTLCGIPLVHINMSYYGKPLVAKGIIAIGNVSVGLISLGVLSLGLLSLGAFALGLLFAFGAISVGGISFGGVAVGIFAFGGLAVGVYAFGGCAIASNIGAGGYASGYIAIGDQTKGVHQFHVDSASRAEARRMIKECYPQLPNFIVKLFTVFLKG